MKGENEAITTRREILTTATSASGLALAAACASQPAGRVEGSGGADEANEHAEVTPGEDLMQEHGALERILLLYDEAASRLENGAPLEIAIVRSAAEIVRRFVEDYHEVLEEQHVFPMVEAAGRELELVAVLRKQHRRGRELTDEVLRLTAGTAQTGELAAVLRSFGRMYRPHAAREDTVLFPVFREVVGGRAYRELGEEFEEREHELLGQRGFEDVVGDLARLEAALGTGDLDGFTA